MANQKPAAIRRPIVVRLLVVQIAVVVLMIGVSGWTHGASGALSSLKGGLVCLLPGFYFAWRAFRLQGARHARQIMTNFYRAEAGKFGLTVALFILIFAAVPPSNPAYFFGAYVAALGVHWLSPLLVKRTTSP
ncbi:F0F1 ATP synthase subunit I [Larsenimonas suaedae]|uniref:F0F1 ATP synthase subunit I n=1 Tax=Larsenimonas suaedae TaxID=1851019 RepID=A0ABU1GR35_9GAMM|nr:F0F1 ATP synthase subunit I [Larsenimonas suaedae]MDR5894481.1 F0F1 ATP synthase subunit I [Larsenimonas suaedae]